jgi:hypothetical protein
MRKESDLVLKYRLRILNIKISRICARSGKDEIDALQMDNVSLPRLEGLAQARKLGSSVGSSILQHRDHIRMTWVKSAHILNKRYNRRTNRRREGFRGSWSDPARGLEKSGMSIVISSFLARIQPQKMPPGHKSYGVALHLERKGLTGLGTVRLGSDFGIMG